MTDQISASDILQRQQTYFKSGITRKPEFRIQQLKMLKEALQEEEENLMKAVYKDFRKPEFEVYATELGVLHGELNYAIKNVNSWASEQDVSGFLPNFPSRNYMMPEPYGSVLIISPWNYPLMLSLSPVIGAIAAGNTVVLKPSEISSHSSDAMYRLVEKYFKPELLKVVKGGKESAKSLLAEKFDYIFYTGSARVGKIVMKAAAEHITPVTLELGGKSPCIIHESADMESAVRRIAWAKFVNAGQTCVAPDYLLVPESYRAPVIELFRKELMEMYGEKPQESPDFSRVINSDHFSRLSEMLDDPGIRIAVGGVLDPVENYIAPTILDSVTTESRCMQEEIFGPILPVLSYSSEAEAIDIVKQYPKPLALYVFTGDEQFEQAVLQSCSFGGGAVNDAVTQMGNHHLPFGGVGNSGMGSYHGKASFDTFTHYKSIMKKQSWLDVPLRFAPYNGKLKWIKKIMK